MALPYRQKAMVKIVQSVTGRKDIKNIEQLKNPMTQIYGHIKWDLQISSFFPSN